MAWLEKNGNGIRVCWKNDLGKVKTKQLKGVQYSKSIFKQLQKGYLPVFEQELLLKQEPKNRQDKLTVEFFYNQLLKLKTTASTSTIRKYKGAWKSIGKSFGSKDPASITVHDLKLWMADEGQRISQKTLKDYLSMFRTILNVAVEMRYLDVNPINLLGNNDKPRPKKPLIQPFTAEEVQIILQSADGWFQNFCAIGFYTGARPGEILGIKWKNVDWNKNAIWLDESVTSDEGKMKTEESERWVPISSMLLPYLKKQYDITGSEETYMFLNHQNSFIHRTDLLNKRYWNPLIKKTGIKHRRMYEMRHSFATNAIQSDAYTIMEVSKILGHTSIETTMRRYVKFLEGLEKGFNPEINPYSATNSTTMESRKVS